MLNELFIRRIAFRYIIGIFVWLTLLTFAVTVLVLYDLSTVLLKNRNEEEIIILNVDQRGHPSYKELILKLESKYKSSPLSYLKKVKKEYPEKNLNETCAQLPYPMDLKYHNHYWQLLESSNGTFYLFGAYFDTRDEERPAIRILAMVDRLEVAITPYFQIWMEGVTEPILAEASFDWAWYVEWEEFNGSLQPYIITAYIDQEYLHMEPAVVSIVENACDFATNCLKVFNLRPEAVKNVAFCVKGMDFLYTDLTLKLVEWLELLQIMGVDKVFLYDFHVHPNITKVLDYYKKIDFVDVTPLSLPSTLPNNPILQHEYLEEKLDAKRKLELIPYNDCLYKNLYSYKYIVPIDIDEVIVPLLDDTMGELITRLEESVDIQPDSFNAQNLYFLDRYMKDKEYPSTREVPPYMHMMRHIYGATNTSGPHNYLKSLLNVNTVVVAHNHYPIVCREYPCNDFLIDPEIGRMHHYRDDCAGEEKNPVTCEEHRQNYQMDKTLWKYKNRLIPKVKSALKELGVLK